MVVSDRPFDLIVTETRYAVNQLSFSKMTQVEIRLQHREQTCYAHGSPHQNLPGDHLKTTGFTLRSKFLS